MQLAEIVQTSSSHSRRVAALDFKGIVVMTIAVSETKSLKFVADTILCRRSVVMQKSLVGCTLQAQSQALSLFVRPWTRVKSQNILLKLAHQANVRCKVPIVVIKAQ